MEVEQLLNTVMRVGTMLMSSGAEVYRVEDTMNRIAKSFQEVESVQSYVTATGIMLSINIEGKTRTHIARVRNRNVNVDTIDQINQLSRTCVHQHLSTARIEEELDRIANQKRYSFLTTTLFGALGAFGFAIFFKGNWQEMLASFGIGIMIRCAGWCLTSLKVNDFLNNLVCAMVAAWMSVEIHSFVPEANINVMVISSIMLLVPGLAITNAIRDTMSTDYLSGLARGAEAFLCATAIAIGAGVILYIWR